jgi:hypothetical protein
MKTPFIIYTILFLLCLSTIQINAQTAEPKLNQVELIKQLIGSWKSEINKDTTEYMESKSYGDGVEGYKRYYSNGRINMEGKQLYAYDRKNDKFILSGLFIGMDNQFCELWFTSKNKCVVYPYDDILKLQKSPFYVELEFKSPDLILFKLIVNGDIINTYTITREKK